MVNGRRVSKQDELVGWKSLDRKNPQLNDKRERETLLTLHKYFLGGERRCLLCALCSMQ
jgi:hypothetical protein